MQPHDRDRGIISISLSASIEFSGGEPCENAPRAATEDDRPHPGHSDLDVDRARAPRRQSMVLKEVTLTYPLVGDDGSKQEVEDLLASFTTESRDLHQEGENHAVSTPDRRRADNVVRDKPFEEVRLSEPEVSPTGGDKYLVATQAGVRDLLAELRGVNRVALDLETTGLDPRAHRVRLLTLSTGRGTWLVDCFEVDPRPLFPILAEKTLVIHNALFDLGFLSQMGFEIGESGEVIDTMLLSQLVGLENADDKENA